MEVQIEEGMTLVNRYDESYNIQFIPKDAELAEVVVEFREFLLACGFSEVTINDYIEKF